MHGDRAVVEISAGIEFRDVIGGVEADLTSFTRLIYRLEKTAGTWQIVSLDPIYERDSLVPTVPGEIPQIDRAALAAVRAPYRFLGYYLVQSGYDITDDLYADDRSDEVEDLYRTSFAWLRRLRPSRRNHSVSRDDRRAALRGSARERPVDVTAPGPRRVGEK